MRLFQDFVPRNDDRGKTEGDNFTLAQNATNTD
jgi:hypothetical protein